MRFEVAFVDLVAPEFFADATPRQTAMVSAQLDPAAVLFENSLQIGALDLAGELVRDLREGPAEVELETEWLVMAGDDLIGKISRVR